jgi:ribosomal protein L37E
MTKAMSMEEIANTVWHTGRAFTGHTMEDECPCPQEACGLIDLNKADTECSQHGFGKSKTMRQGHTAENCPGVSE